MNRNFYIKFFISTPAFTTSIFQHPSSFLLPNMCSRCQYSSFLHYYNSILYRIGSVVTIRNMFTADNFYVIPDIAVLIKDRFFNVTVFSDAHIGTASPVIHYDFCSILVKVSTHYIGIDNGTSLIDSRSVSDH